MSASDSNGPHAGQPVLEAGAELEGARAAVLLVHGRGATAESILALSRELGRDDVAYLAPQAAGYTWYPHSFLAPIEHNEPDLTSGLAALWATLEGAERAGIPSERQLLLGFSQGACLTLELAARDARRFGGVIGFTGGLIGPRLERERYRGAFEGTPIFLGSSDPDPHVPWTRVAESGALLEEMGASVDLRSYRGMPHTINGEEIEVAREMLRRAAGGA